MTRRGAVLSNEGGVGTKEGEEYVRKAREGGHLGCLVVESQRLSIHGILVDNKLTTVNE